MAVKRLCLLAAAWLGIAGAAAPSPDDLYGPLFRAVELARVFPDSKTFPDMVPRMAPAAIMAAFRAEHPQGRAALAAFVARYFQATGTAPPSDPPLRAHIKALWPLLARPPLAAPAGSSLLALPHAYVVAGGRYQEMYYWDSYFTMLGLKADGEQALVEAMLDDFADLVARYGHVPNGTRSYYLSRSQPPFLALMTALSDAADPATDNKRLAAMKAEHDWWMAGAACLDANGACRRVVRMPDGSLLNRYWDDRDTPRDESYREDVETAAAAASRFAADTYRDLRAGAESGWDYSSRWLRDGHTLATIHTGDIVPIDLNSLLWTLEQTIAHRCAARGDAACAREFDLQAARRRAAINTYLWSQTERRFVDWDRARGAPTPVVSAAAFVPLFVGLATPAQATATARLAETTLLAPGGLRTTARRTGQQWDAPNGWAPLLWMAVSGLDRYGHRRPADTLARRWIVTVSRFYACTGRLIEKYDVESGQAGGGGEYLVQDGFGWTNGVTRVLLDRPGIAGAVVTRCPAPASAAIPPAAGPG